MNSGALAWDIFGTPARRSYSARCFGVASRTYATEPGSFSAQWIFDTERLISAEISERDVGVVLVIMHLWHLVERGASPGDCNTVRETNMLAVGVRLSCRISQSHGTCQPHPRGFFIASLNPDMSLARPIEIWWASHFLRRSDIMIDCEPERFVGQRETFLSEHHRDLSVVECVRNLQQLLRDWFLVHALERDKATHSREMVGCVGWLHTLSTRKHAPAGRK